MVKEYATVLNFRNMKFKIIFSFLMLSCLVVRAQNTIQAIINTENTDIANPSIPSIKFIEFIIEIIINMVKN